MKIHRHLIWIKAAPALIEELLSDKKIKAVVAVRVDPGLCGVLSKDYDNLIKRLHDLRHAPQEITNA